MRALVVEDSAFQRLRIQEALAESRHVSSVETAVTGEEAIRKLLSDRFDLVTLDLGLPDMDGQAVLRWIMANRPVPVVVVSAERQERRALLALEAGAIDFVGKATAQPEAIARWKRRLAEAVEGARQISFEGLRQRTASQGRPAPQPRRAGKAPAVGEAPALVVAASTGGPPALRDFFLDLGPLHAVVAVAQHMPPPFTRSLASRLSTGTGWDVREAEPGGEALPGVVWIAPGGHHLEFARSAGRVVLRVTPHTGRVRWCPSADLLFESAARTFGERTVALVLTGMGDDGSAGAAAVAAAGGAVLCEGRETAVIPGMPDAAARAAGGALRAPLRSLAAAVQRSVAERLASGAR